MIKRSQNIINSYSKDKDKRKHIISRLIPVITILLLLFIWQVFCWCKVLPGYMLPSPIDVVKAIIYDFPNLRDNMWVTLEEAALGLFLGVLIGFIFAVLMDSLEIVRQGIYPILVLSQTIPTVAIAPLLVLWLGYGIAPKIVLIILVTFFPVAMGLLEGFMSTDKDMINLMKSMGAGKMKIFLHVTLPGSLGRFFSSLKIAISYAIVGAVISEWLGGFSGLGVYMTRVRKSYSYDKMFAVIFLISFISLVLIEAVKLIEKKVMLWENKESN